MHSAGAERCANDAPTQIATFGQSLVDWGLMRALKCAEPKMHDARLQLTTIVARPANIGPQFDKRGIGKSRRHNLYVLFMRS